jgi:UDP-glucuronate decarboxylase
MDDVQEIVERLGKDAHRFAGKTILLSGGAGFLGRHFVATFGRLNATVLSAPCRVISVDNYITGKRISLHENERHDPNILDVWADVTYPLPLREDVHFVLHAAGVASPVFYMKYPLETIESSVEGSRTLLDFSRRTKTVESFLLFSSSEIYGDPAPSAIPTPETYFGYVSSTGPRACYDESKRLAETIATVYCQHFDIPVKIVRPFNVFGPGMQPYDRRVVPTFTYGALNRKPLPVHGDGRQTRTFCYITDAIVGFLQALLHGKKGEAYNIGNSDNEIAMADFAQLFAEMIPGAVFERIPYPDTYPAGEPQRRCPDLTKAASHLNYAPAVDMRDGLGRFIAWARDQDSYKVQA